MVSEEGKLFTATAREAKYFSLADGIVDDMDAISKVASGLKGWKAKSDRGIKIMQSFGRRSLAAVKSINKQLEVYKKEYNLAVKTDPTRKRYDLSAGKKFTRAARAKWQRYSRECYGHLKKCEAALGKIASEGKKFPNLQVQVDAVREYKASVQKMRKSIAKGAGRRGV